MTPIPGMSGSSINNIIGVKDLLSSSPTKTNPVKMGTSISGVAVTEQEQWDWRTFNPAKLPLDTKTCEISRDADGELILILEKNNGDRFVYEGANPKVAFIGVLVGLGLLFLAGLTFSSCAQPTAPILETPDLITPDPTSTGFITDNTKLEDIRKQFLVDNSAFLGLDKILPKMLGTWNYAETNYFQTIVINGKSCTFVQDPSQSNLIVSEGQGFWLRISALLAKLDTTNAAKYQTMFDQILNGYQAMQALSRANGNSGNLGAWAVKISNGVLVADTTKSGPYNSAADADVDVAEGLSLAMENVASGLWTNNNYNTTLTTYAPFLENLYKTVNGVKVLGPSEDWSDFYFIDYSRVHTTYKLYDFYQQQGNTTKAVLWMNNTKGAFLEYFEALRDTNNCPAQAYVTAGTEYTNDLQVTQRYPQGWDGVRWALNVASALEYINPNQGQQKVLSAAAKNHGNGYTVPALDSAMYFLLALKMGDAALAKTIAQNMVAGFGANTIYNDPTRYYQSSLIFLALLELYQPIDTANSAKITLEETNYPAKGISSRAFEPQISAGDYADRWGLRKK